MTYSKPNIKYTTMAIWIDEHVYNSSYDENQLYEYLYHLSHMLARQYDYYKTASEYDSFSLYCASRLFLRLINPKQFDYDDNGNPKLKPIKSILNYIKKVIYMYKVDFEKELISDNSSLDVIDINSFDLDSYLADSASLFSKIDYPFNIGDICSITKTYLSKIPYKKNSSEWLNIYISCILTLLDSCTLPNWVIRKYNTTNTGRFEVVEKLYRDQRYNKPILYHLPSTMSNYIAVLVNELRHIIAAELSWTGNEYINSSELMKSMLASSFEKGDMN